MKAAHPDLKSHRDSDHDGDQTPSGSESTFDKTSSSESLPLEDCQDEHLWFSDGDIVLATTDADDSRLFRVHKGVLAQHSIVFKDMFYFPMKGDDMMEGDDALEVEEPEGGAYASEKQETYGGLPLVFLSGDKSEDVVHLLRAMYEGGFVAFSVFLHT